MLIKTMKQLLDKKINKWLNSIKSPEVKAAIRKDLIITGGCMTSMIKNTDINDFDCYFRTKETTMLVAQYYAELWNKSKHHGTTRTVTVVDCDKRYPEDAIRFFDVGRVKIFIESEGIVGNPELANSNEELGIDSTMDMVSEIDETKADKIIEKEKRSYYPVFMSSNAITLSDKIQLIVRFYGEPDKIHDTFDFDHTKAYYDYFLREIVIPQSVWECATNMTLRYTGSKYPVCSMFRLRKFINRGWKINAGQMLKIALQISDLDLTDVDVLEDQLIGVDSSYFMQLIEQFRNMKKADGKFDLTRGYIETVIDKIF